jgi:Xaa-Pro aminopeptidase
MDMELPTNINALFITNPTNIRYITGFVGADPKAREAYVLILGPKAYLFTNSLYLELAKKLPTSLPSGYELVVMQLTNIEPIWTHVAAILTAGGYTKGRLGFEELDMTVAEFVALRKFLPNATAVATRNIVEDTRRKKRQDEISSIRAACTLTDSCFTFLQQILVPGVKESDIVWEISSFFHRHGAEDAFTPIVAFGAHASQPHFSPKAAQDASLQENDLVLIDFGAKVNGYCADMTRVVFIGTPKPEWKKAYKTVLAAQQEAIDEIVRSINASNEAKTKIAISGGKLDTVAREVIEKGGLSPYTHSLGHAVGLDIHEGPRLTSHRDEMLESGMVFSIEPGVYVEGQFGIRIEDLVYISDTSLEILSQSPKDIPGV